MLIIHAKIARIMCPLKSATMYCFYDKSRIIKVSGYTFRASNSVNKLCPPHINWGHLIKKRICSHRSKFFPLRVDPISEHRPPGMQTGSHENCLILKTWRNPYALKAISSLQSEEGKNKLVPKVHLSADPPGKPFITRIGQDGWMT